MWKCESVYNLISYEHLHFEKHVRFSNTWLGQVNKQKDDTKGKTLISLSKSDIITIAEAMTTKDTSTQPSLSRWHCLSIGAISPLFLVYLHVWICLFGGIVFSAVHQSLPCSDVHWVEQKYCHLACFCSGFFFAPNMGQHSAFCSCCFLYLLFIPIPLIPDMKKFRRYSQ